ncbi:MAG: trypsin-like peptidase domain-containing protein [Oscillospiraceae bacterium]
MDEYTRNNESAASEQTTPPPVQQQGALEGGRQQATPEAPQAPQEGPAGVPQQAAPTPQQPAYNGYYHWQNHAAPPYGTPQQPVQNTGSYYNAQQPTQGAGYYTAPQQASAPQGPAQPPKKKHRVLPTLALVVACALAGFGGGQLALSSAGGLNTTVVYRTAETGIENASSSKDSQTVAQVAAVASASVVSIETEVQTQTIMGESTGTAAGSGVILTADGYIVTNNHVVEGASSITVILPDGTRVAATLVGADSVSDLAVVKIEAEGLTPAVIGSSSSLQVGDFCLAVGNSMGTLNGTVTDGIISALSREVTIDNTTMTLLQMSAAISPGNSGGGLFNIQGELVGIVNAKSGAESSEGLGFAIPVDTVAQVVEQLMENGYVKGRPALGVSVLEVSGQQQAAQLGLSQEGIYIQEVTAGGAAEQAGLQVGDRIASLDGTEVTTLAELSKALQQKTAGEKAEVQVQRGTQLLSFEVTLQEAANNNG